MRREFFSLPAELSSNGVEVQPGKLTKLKFLCLHFNFNFISFECISSPFSSSCHFTASPPGSSPSASHFSSPLSTDQLTLFSLSYSFLFLPQSETFQFYSDIFSMPHYPSSSLFSIYSWRGKNK